MTMRRPAIFLLTAVASLMLAGCGQSDDKNTPTTTPKKRVAACLEQQPDATRSDCEAWEQDGMLAEDGTHEDHENMS